MNSFIEALKVQPGLAKLSMTACDFLESSDRMLVDYLRGDSTVCDFGLSQTGLFSYTNKLSSASLKDLLTTCRPVLRVLRMQIDLVGNQEFAQWMASNAADVRIAHLRLDVGSDQNWLHVFLEGLCHVDSIEVVVRECSSIDLVAVKQALRKNASLHHVSFIKRDGNDGELFVPVLTLTERRSIDAYGQRNQLLPALLSTTNSGRAELSGIPELLVAACALPPKKLQTRILSGTLALDANKDHVATMAAASGCDGKRAAPNRPPRNELN